MFDSNPASQLCGDLLQMYLKQINTDICLMTKNDSEIWAHKLVLFKNYNFFNV